MTDKKFQDLINRTVKAKHKHAELLKQAEAEYEKRYGNNPSKVDDDVWIDTMHLGCGNADLKLLHEFALLCNKK